MSIKGLNLNDDGMTDFGQQVVGSYPLLGLGSEQYSGWAVAGSAWLEQWPPWPGRTVVEQCVALLGSVCTEAP